MVILAPSSSANLESVVKKLAEDGKDCEILANEGELRNKLHDARVFCVFISDRFSKDVLATIREGKKLSQALWILETSLGSPDKLSQKALSAGVQLVLPGPVNSFQYVLRARQMLALFNNSLEPALNTERVSEPGFSAYQEKFRDYSYKKPVPKGLGGGAFGASAAARQLVVAPKNFPKNGYSFVPHVPDYAKFRQSWVAETRVLAERLKSSVPEEIKALVKNALNEISRSPDHDTQLSLVALRVDSCLQELPSYSFRHLEWSDDFHDQKERPHKIEERPDLVNAVEYKRPVLVNLGNADPLSRAAIPLLSNDKVVGILNVEVLGGDFAQIMRFMGEISAHAPNFVEAFLRLDFLSRIYRPLEVERERKKKSGTDIS